MKIKIINYDQNKMMAKLPAELKIDVAHRDLHGIVVKVVYKKGVFDRFETEDKVLPDSINSALLDSGIVPFKLPSILKQNLQIVGILSCSNFGINTTVPKEIMENVSKGQIDFIALSATDQSLLDLQLAGFSIESRYCLTPYTQAIPNTEAGHIGLQRVILSSTCNWIVIQGLIFKHEIGVTRDKKERPTTVVAVSWSLTREGCLLPSVQIKPIVLHGRTYENVSISSAFSIKDLGLFKGTKVSVAVGNNNLPFIVSSQGTKATEITIPKICPYCKVTTVKRENQLICPNSECSGVMKAHLAYVISDVLAATNVNTSKIDSLFKKAPTFFDCFHLTIRDLENLSGFGPTTSQALHALFQRKARQLSKVDQALVSGCFVDPLGMTLSTTRLEKALERIDSRKFSYTPTHSQIRALLESIPGFNVLSINCFVRGYYKFLDWQTQYNRSINK